MFNGATYDGTATQFAGAGGFMAEYVRATREARATRDSRDGAMGDSSRFENIFENRFSMMMMMMNVCWGDACERAVGVMCVRVSD